MQNCKVIVYIPLIDRRISACGIIYLLVLFVRQEPRATLIQNFKVHALPSHWIIKLYVFVRTFKRQMCMQYFNVVVPYQSLSSNVVPCCTFCTCNVRIFKNSYFFHQTCSDNNFQKVLIINCRSMSILYPLYQDWPFCKVWKVHVWVLSYF